MNKEATENKNLTKKAEGEKAIDALYNALDKDGLLTDDLKNKNLAVKVKKLETEVELLKDLISRALNVKKNKVLKG